jgi:sulfate adenylyltransferase subunit 1
MSTISEISAGSINEGLPTTLFRFATAGSVDDGKSTLVGRLLHDSKAILADTLDAVARTSADRGFGGDKGGIDLALLTDGLRAEREQGRLPRARSVHQEHGDRRVHCGCRRRTH